MLGCTKQNVSYWSLHSYSSQTRNSLYEVINESVKLFLLSNADAESLANSAGLSLHYIGGDIIKILEYDGKLKELCYIASVSERMLRLYRHKTPTKQTILALAVALNKSCSEIENILYNFGYCLSDSVVGDVVVKWYLERNKDIKNNQLILEINETLDKMNLPLIMTKQS